VGRVGVEPHPEGTQINREGGPRGEAEGFDCLKGGGKKGIT